MIEYPYTYRYGDMWELERGDDEVIVVTTNGAVRNDGACVMGRGIARQVRDSRPELPFKLGALIREHGNRPFRLEPTIWTLPVKHHWAEKADPALIASSLSLMSDMVAKFQPRVMHLPRPGCGNGQLSWDEVGPLVGSATADWQSEVNVWTFRM